jgi:hypothetical protein
MLESQRRAFNFGGHAATCWGEARNLGSCASHIVLRRLAADKSLYDATYPVFLIEWLPAPILAGKSLYNLPTKVIGIEAV